MESIEAEPAVTKPVKTEETLKEKIQKCWCAECTKAKLPWAYQNL